MMLHFSLNDFAYNGSSFHGKKKFLKTHDFLLLTECIQSTTVCQILVSLENGSPQWGPEEESRSLGQSPQELTDNVKTLSTQGISWR